MDPNAQNPQGESDAVKKLEKDLQNLKQETPVTPQQPAPMVEPLQPLPQVPEETPAPPVPSVPSPSPVEASAPIPDVPKKGSPLMIIAIVLALVAVLAVVAYVFGAKLLSPQPTPTPIVVVVPTPTPDVTANWKTYTNTYFNFSFKYPQNWNLRLFPGTFEDITTANNFVLEGPYESIATLQGGPSYSIKIETSSKNVISTDSKVTIVYKQVRPDLYVRFEISNSIPGQENVDMTTFGQILSTFKFTSATPVASPAPGTGEIPADLVVVVKQNAADQSSPKVTVDKVIIGQFQVEGNYASVAFGYVDGGGAIFWLSKTGGIWKVVTGGQEPPKCSLLKSFNFPADFGCNP